MHKKGKRVSYRRCGVVSLGAALALLSDAGHAGVNSWSIKGPPGGIFRDVRASSTESRVFYATYSRSVHRSTDGGVTWTTLKTFASQVNGLAVDPLDGNRLYVAVLDHGVFRSEDGGESFIQIAPAGSGVWGVGTNGATLFYAMGSQVYRSDDRGQSWSGPTAATQTLTRILVDPQDSSLVYSFSGPNVIRSTDGGLSWPEVRVNPDLASTTSVNDIAQLNATRFIAACNDGLWTSNDRGVTWSRATAGSFDSIAVDPSTPGRAVAARRGIALLQVTTDYGATWSTFGDLPPLRHEGVSFATGAPTRIVALGQQGALYSSNDAHSWTEATRSPVASNPTQFATTVAANSRIYTYTSEGGGGLFATSGDAEWQRLNLAAAQVLNPGAEFGQASIAVKPGKPSSIFFGVFDRGVFRSNDGGNSWIAPNTDLGGFSPQVFAFDPQDPNTMFVSVYKVSTTPAAGIYRSSDGGATWQPHSTNLPTTLVGLDLQVDPSDPARMFLAADQGFAAGTPGGLYRSLDRGLSWVQSFTGQDVRSVAIDPSNGSRVYVAAETGLYVSDDGGDSFVANDPYAIIANEAASSVVLDPTVPTTVYAASRDPGYSFGILRSSSILRSVDAGATWEVLRGPWDDGAPWYVGQLVLDPNNPSLIHAATRVQGVATFEVSPDLSVEIVDHSGTRPRGHESTFNLRAVNNGPYHATAVKLSAVVPAGLTSVSISADHGTCASTTCVIPVLRVGEEINAVVKYTTPASALVIPVTATVAAHENDPVATNNSTQASATTGDPGDLGVALRSSVSSVTQGGNVTYIVTVTNRGTTAASEGTVAFQLGSNFTLGSVPAGCSSAGGSASCKLDTLAPGAMQAFSFSAVATSVGSVDATANVAFGPSMFDVNPADNEATSSVTATTPAASATPARRGGRGGGGALDILTLFGGLLLMFGNRRSKRAI